MRYQVVPRESSQLGNDREAAETVHANHRNMCKFQSRDDANYQKVGRHLEVICETIRRNRLEQGP